MVRGVVVSPLLYLISSRSNQDLNPGIGDKVENLLKPGSSRRSSETAWMSCINL